MIARTSAFKYRGKEVDPQEVAKALGVQAIVTGRVMQRGDQLQVSAELVNAADKTQIWGEQFNRKATDASMIQTEIAQQIAMKLRSRLTNAEQRHMAKNGDVNPQAYELVLKALFFRRKNSPNALRKTVEHCNQAIAIDEKYAPAYAMLADAYRWLAASSFMDPKEAKPKAEATVRKALELDESLAEAHLAWARLRMDDWDWTGAERESRRALELNPISTTRTPLTLSYKAC